eukprot:COSAG01_NODE_4288_length_5171_cov_4.864156_2_plen_152_part_00
MSIDRAHVRATGGAAQVQRAISSAQHAPQMALTEDNAPVLLRDPRSSLHVRKMMKTASEASRVMADACPYEVSGVSVSAAQSIAKYGPTIQPQEELSRYISATIKDVGRSLSAPPMFPAMVVTQRNPGAQLCMQRWRIAPMGAAQRSEKYK